MANVKISALPAAVAASGTDVVPVVQGTTTKKLSMSGLLTSPTLFAPGMSTFFATPSSANLRGVLTDETGTGSAVFADAPTLTAPTISGGDMGFSSLGQRIKGDLTTATVSNRLLFQTSTVNGTTSVGAIPNGTATTAGFAAANSSDANNASIGILQATPTVVSVTATKTGTGSFLPLTFVTSNIERMRIDTSGNVNIPTAGARITGDFSGATVANRLMFQTSTAASPTRVDAIPGAGTTTAEWGAFNNSDPTNASRATLTATAADVRVQSTITGTGTYLPMTFYTGGSERVRVDTSGNVGIGTAGPSGNLQVSAANTRVRFSNTAGTASTLLFGADSGQVFLGAETNAPVYFITNNAERMRIDSTGNVGIGRAPNYQLDVYRSGTTNSTVAAANDNVVNILQVSGNTAGVVGTLTSHPVIFTAGNTERMRITATGNIVAGASAALATTATDGFLYVPTCAGTPTGVPTAITGMAPIVVNTTNNKLYFYSGGAWRDAGP